MQVKQSEHGFQTYTACIYHNVVHDVMKLFCLNQLFLAELLMQRKGFIKHVKTVEEVEEVQADILSGFSFPEPSLDEITCIKGESIRT